MDQLLGQAVASREPLAGHDGRSGAAIDRAVLADGRRLIVKTSDPAADLVMAVSGDDDGRELRLWESGTFARLPDGVGNAVVDGWRDAGGKIVLVMRDLGPSVLGWHDRLSARDCRSIIDAMVAVHRTFEGAEIPGLCALEKYLTGLSPAVIRPYRGGPSPLPALLLEGWSRFAELAPAEVWDWVQAVFDDPVPLASEFRRKSVTLVHGDLWPVNVALESDQVTFLDWGFAVAASGPVELGAFLSGIAGVAEPTRDDLVAMYQQASGYAPEQVERGLSAGLLQYGWNVALGATDDDPGHRARLLAELDWWIAKLRATHLT